MSAGSTVSPARTARTRPSSPTSKPSTETPVSTVMPMPSMASWISAPMSGSTGERLGRLVDDRGLEPAVDHGLGHLDADVARAHDDGAPAARSRQVLDDRLALLERLHAEDARASDALQRRPVGTAPVAMTSSSYRARRCRRRRRRARSPTACRGRSPSTSVRIRRSIPASRCSLGGAGDELVAARRRPRRPSRGCRTPSTTCSDPARARRPRGRPPRRGAAPSTPPTCRWRPRRSPRCAWS